MKTLEEDAMQLLFETSLVGIHAVAHTPNHQSWFEAPLVNTCSDHYGVAFFFAGDREKIEKVRQILQKELGLEEVTESVQPVFNALLGVHGL